MKNLILLSIALFAFCFSASAQAADPAGTPQTDPNAPAFKWEEEIHDFGKIPQGIPATTRYYFTNVGKTPLSITEAKPTCGCTTPDWTREPIAPGKRGYVEATYNAAGVGNFQKSVTVISNATPAPISLTLKGEVLPKENPTPTPVPPGEPVPVQPAPQH